MSKSNLYFEKLDELRFFAFFLVFWQHGFSDPITQWLGAIGTSPMVEKLLDTGGVGVHVFFVISGFLITYLMINEENITGRFNLKFFYVRRVLRIWPVYYLVMVAGVFVLPSLFNTFAFHGSAVKQLLFLNNFDPSPGSFVGIAWSVAIEEQFYLFWPLVFLLLPNKNALLAFCGVVFFGSVAFILFNPETYYFHTFGNLKYLMSGCFAAILYTRYLWLAESKIMNGGVMLGIVSVVCAVLYVFSDINQSLNLVTNLMLPLLYAYIVVNVVNRKGTETPSSFSTLGKYTYGMYLYHPAIIMFIKIAFDVQNLDYQGNFKLGLVLSVLCLVTTILLAIVSYSVFEKPILTFKNRFSFIKTRV